MICVYKSWVNYIQRIECYTFASLNNNDNNKSSTTKTNYQQLRCIGITLIPWAFGVYCQAKLAGWRTVLKEAKRKASFDTGRQPVMLVGSKLHPSAHAFHHCSAFAFFIHIIILLLTTSIFSSLLLLLTTTSRPRAYVIIWLFET